MATRARRARTERTNWPGGIYTLAGPLPLTRHRVVRHHQIHGTPWRAHLIEDPASGVVKLYIASRPVAEFSDVQSAMEDVATRTAAAGTP